MDEYRPPEARIAPIPGRPQVPISAYVMAVISGSFVTFGVMFLAAFSHLFVGDLLASAPRPVVMSIPFVAIGLGILAAWQAIGQAKRKAAGAPKREES